MRANIAYDQKFRIHARPRETDRQTHGQTDEHHGSSATIRSNERTAR